MSVGLRILDGLMFKDYGIFWSPSMPEAVS